MVESYEYKNTLRNNWKFDAIEPEIMDFEPYSEQLNNFMIILRQLKTGFFSGNNSELIYVELK